MPRKWPEVNELVVGTVTEITDYGAYVSLDEYDGKKAFIYISEIKRGYVKRVRDYLREGQKVVARVINVDPDKDIIDLSLRYVTEREKQLKMKDYKDRKKAYKIVELALTGTPYESEIKRIFYLLDENFENPYIGLEEARRKGKTVLLKLGIADEIADILMKEIMERVKPSYTSLVYQVRVESLARDGVFKIMDYLEKCKKNLEKRDIKNVEITVISPPLYRIRVLHENPKYVEQTFKKVALEMLKVAKEMNIEAEFKTER